MLTSVWQSNEAISFLKRIGDERRDRFANEARDDVIETVIANYFARRHQGICLHRFGKVMKQSRL